ncbi:MAG: hypothetical protein KatS3mg076_1656 [Candidatus Binatia bacterium]|nr:MAG: hypothetical protein KatS3mg076_1656 [Candidatus Binatia bacterium]
MPACVGSRSRSSTGPVTRPPAWSPAGRRVPPVRRHPRAGPQHDAARASALRVRDRDNRVSAVRTARTRVCARAVRAFPGPKWARLHGKPAVYREPRVQRRPTRGRRGAAIGSLERSRPVRGRSTSKGERACRNDAECIGGGYVRPAGARAAASAWAPLKVCVGRHARPVAPATTTPSAAPAARCPGEGNFLAFCSTVTPTAPARSATAPTTRTARRRTRRPRRGAAARPAGRPSRSALRGPTYGRALLARTSRLRADGVCANDCAPIVLAASRGGLPQPHAPRGRWSVPWPGLGRRALHDGHRHHLGRWIRAASAKRVRRGFAEWSGLPRSCGTVPAERVLRPPVMGGSQKRPGRARAEGGVSRRRVRGRRTRPRASTAMPCTDDDPETSRGVANTIPQTTGLASTFIADVDLVAGRMILHGSCSGVPPSRGHLRGDRFSEALTTAQRCSADPPSVGNLRIAASFPALDQQVGDSAVITSLKARPGESKKSVDCGFASGVVFGTKARAGVSTRRARSRSGLLPGEGKTKVNQKGGGNV